MVLEILEYAKRSRTLEEYKRFSELQEVTTTQNPHDRFRTLSLLLDEEIVKRDIDGRLFINTRANLNFLLPNLEKGEKKAWKILDLYFPESPISLKFDDSRNSALEDKITKANKNLFLIILLSCFLKD